MRLSLTSLLVIGLALSVSACAPKDEQLISKRGAGAGDGGGGGGDKGTPGGGNSGVTAQAIQFDDLALARHLILKVTTASRMVQLAVGEKLNSRADMNAGDEVSAGDCRTLVKLSPGQERTLPAYVERFQVNYKKCYDQSTEVTSAEIIKGTENYTVTYSQLVPKPGEPGDLAIPESIIVDGAGFETKVVPASHKKDLLYLRSSHLLTVLLDQANETQLIYKASLRTQTRFEYDVAKTLRKGVTEVAMDSVQIVVDRATRSVVSIAQSGPMNIEIHGDQWTKSDFAGTTLSNRTKMELVEFNVTPTSAIALSGDRCVVPNASFQVNTGRRTETGTEVVQVQTTDGWIVAPEVANPVPQEVKLCQAATGAEEEKLLFAGDIGALYLKKSDPNPPAQ